MNIRNITQSGMFAALMALCAWICLPVLGVPVTMQSFVIFLAVLALGGKCGSVSVLVYLCLGAAGLPVFSGFAGGIGALTGPTGGYLWGFLLGALAYWCWTSLCPKRKFLGLLILQLVCYTAGVAWFSCFYAAGRSVWEIFLITAAPFLLPDLAKGILAWLIFKRLRKYIAE